MFEKSGVGAVIGWEKDGIIAAKQKDRRCCSAESLCETFSSGLLTCNNLTYHLTRERMECWAALSYCKRDVQRGPINPREPRDFRTFGRFCVPKYK